MKKLLTVLLCLLTFFVSSVTVCAAKTENSSDKVTVYIFRGHGCSHCYESLEYFYDNIKNYSDKIEVKAYEVWYNQNNSQLASAVATKLGDVFSGGVPYIVVGDSYSVSGFSSEIATEIIAAAEKEYDNKNYVDIVSKLAADYDVDEETLKEACINEEIIEEESDKKGSDGIIIAAIFVVVIGGLSALVILSRKK